MSRTFSIKLDDQKIRELVIADLNHNFLVEASAGSGKTSVLVQRMVALIRSGRYSVHQVVAITFTRKAAIELRERFQEKIEEAFFNSSEVKEKNLLQEALINIEQCYLGTIHSFCAHLLREYSMEAGLNPGFQEINEIDDSLYMEEAWEQYLGNIKAQDRSILKNLEDLNLQVQDLKGCYKQTCQYPEVQLAHEQVPYPELKQAVNCLFSFCDEAIQYIPVQEPDPGYDSLQQAILFVQRIKNYEPFLEKDSNKIILLELFVRNYRISGNITLNRWLSKEKARQFRDSTLPQLQEELLIPAVENWKEYCHETVIRFIQPAVTNYRSFRDEHSLLNFQDLLLTTANLLRENPDIRQSIKKKYRTILVDEFQDTDPIQAEIFFYLTGLENEEKDWRKLVPRAGSLFIVGDPQQSIYHFRRADISVYHQVKNMIQTNKGRIVRLNTNFRSVHSIGEYLNPLFNDLFSSQKSSFQAEYSPMKTIRDEGEGYFSGVYKIAISKEKNQSNTIANDARAIAGLIRDWVDRKVRILRSEEELNQGKTLEVQYSDFMLMLRYKKGMEIYARIMVEYGIPITVSGYSSISQSQIVREFLKLLRLLRDPENQVLMVAVLRGMFYGFSDDDLYQFKESGGEFTLFSSIPERLKKDVKQRFKDVFAQLKLYYSWSLKLLPINVLEKILISSGLHPYACIKNKGSNHLNELYFILEYLKKLEMVDFYTYHGLIEKMEKLYKSGIEEEFDFMAEENVVRIMNLHKAKGLEAPIVFLTVSEHNNKPDPKYYIERLAGIPQGYFLVQKEHDFGKGKILAQPLHWKEYCRLENDYLKAEEIRLLYVAATRARNALIISGFGQNSSQTPWEPLLKNIQSEMILDIPAKHVFEKVEIAYPFELFKQQEQKIGTMYEIAMRSSYVEQIPSSAKQFEKNADRYVFPIQGNGRNWGIIVHKVLEYLVDKQPGKELLSLYIDSVLEKYNLPEYQKSGLTQLVENFKVSQLFYRIQNSLAKYVEMPFCVKVDPSDTLYQELGHGQNPEEEIKFMIMKGVIDLLFKERDGWVIVDYKTGFAKKENQDQEINRVYQHQINIYASIWERMSEEKVKEKIIYYL